MKIFAIFFLGLIVSFIITLLAVKIFPKIKLLDFPERYGLKRKRLPYPGGIIFVILSLVFFLYFPEFRKIILSLTLLATISFWDDKKNLAIFPRLIVHLFSASIIFYFGIKINFIGDPFHATNISFESLPVLSFLITILWIVIVQNALNWFDGIAGLTVGVSGVGFLTLGLLGLIRPELFFDSSQTNLMIANLFFSGICIGACPFFFAKKIILGDTGSQVLGFILAVFAIFSGAKIATTLLVLSLPIIDIFFVIVRRLWQKKSPLSGDLQHIHHNFSRKFGEKGASIILIFISVIFGAIAVFCAGMIKFYALIFAIICILIMNIWILKHN